MTTTIGGPDPSTTAVGKTSGSSNTGPIVGAVVGVVGGLALLTVLLFWLLRRRKRRSDFDGIFDPDRIRPGGKAPAIDTPPAEVTPFPAFGNVGQTQMASAPGMTQYYNQGPAFPTAAPVSPPHSPPPRLPSPDQNYYQGYNPNSLTYQNVPSNAAYNAAAAAAAYGASTQSPTPPGGYLSPGGYGHQQEPSQFGAASSSTPSQYSASSAYGGVLPASLQAGTSAKEREAMGHYVAPSTAGLTLVSPAENESGNRMSAMSGRGSGGTVSPDSGRGVMVHQDGGRIPADSNAPEEIPPTYDSIAGPR